MPAVKEKVMRTVVLVDGSRPSLQALEHLLRAGERPDEVVLLYVAPSAREAHLHQGERALEVARSTCLQFAPGVAVSRRLEVGDVADRTRAVALEEHVDQVVVSRHDAGSFPYLDAASEATHKVHDQCVECHVEVVN